MNILIKLMSIVSLVIAPTLASIHHTKSNAVVKNEKKYELGFTVKTNSNFPAHIEKK
jgi:K(+)-stimulated pyrophosphate-energized sodium pump